MNSTLQLQSSLSIQSPSNDARVSRDRVMLEAKALERWENEGGRILRLVVGSSALTSSAK